MKKLEEILDRIASIGARRFYVEIFLEENQSGSWTKFWRWFASETPELDPFGFPDMATPCVPTKYDEGIGDDPKTATVFCIEKARSWIRSVARDAEIIFQVKGFGGPRRWRE